MERRISTSSRAEELPVKDEGDNRISKLKRKEWSISRSQVIVEKEPETELTSKMVKKITITMTAIIKASAGAGSVSTALSHEGQGSFIKLWEGFKYQEASVISVILCL